MAAKKTSKKTVKKTATKPVAKPVAKKTATPVRKTSIPRNKTVKAAPKPVLTHDLIAVRAFCIFASPRCSTEEQNWLLAERELKDEMGIG